MDCGAFTLWWLARPVDASTESPAGPRVCVVASIAAVGKAVLRTRAKRRLRELFRIHQERIPAGLDLMLIAKSGCVKFEFKELERRFLQACSRLPAPRSGVPPAGSATVVSAAPAMAASLSPVPGPVPAPAWAATPVTPAPVAAASAEKKAGPHSGQAAR